mmetsp:Transcript_19457/g.39926  ORF Transcript_19457/g.39926 Transcript_19457/m.39926 type:complete len:262 (-) Transcript_19457:43-828(-)
MEALPSAFEKEGCALKADSNFDQLSSVFRSMLKIGIQLFDFSLTTLLDTGSMHTVRAGAPLAKALCPWSWKSRTRVMKSGGRTASSAQKTTPLSSPKYGSPISGMPIVASSRICLWIPSTSSSPMWSSLSPVLRKDLKKLSSFVCEATTMGFSPARAMCLANTNWAKPGPTSKTGSPFSMRSVAASAVDEAQKLLLCCVCRIPDDVTKALVAARGINKSPMMDFFENIVCVCRRLSRCLSGWNESVLDEGSFSIAELAGNR